MKIVKPAVILLKRVNYDELLLTIEKAARTCYKSESKITEGSFKETEKFVGTLINRGHEAMIEHASLSFKIICDRGVTHEIVRHRMASYAMESTRYCNYSKDKFENELTFIDPRSAFDWNNYQYKIWEDAMAFAEDSYMEAVRSGMTPQEARSVLPHSIKSEIIVTMNCRELRHFLKLRTSKAAHPQMREVALMMYDIVKYNYPILVKDIKIDE